MPKLFINFFPFQPHKKLVWLNKVTFIFIFYEKVILDAPFKPEWAASGLILDFNHRWEHSGTVYCETCLMCL